MSENALMVFQPYGRRAKASYGKTLLEVSREIGINIVSICGGRGLCGKCRIIIREGAASLSSPSEIERRMFSDEDLENGFRLACQARVTDRATVVVEVPSYSQVEQQKLLLKGLERPVKLAPAIKKLTVRLKKPSLQDVKADVDRLIDAVEVETGRKPKVDYETLKKIPETVRIGDWVVTVTLWEDSEIIQAEPNVTHSLYGVAVDIGTTKIVSYLVDLNLAKIVAVSSMMNPQISYGEDVISRVRYIMENEDGLERLNKSIVEGVNHLISEVCRDSRISSQEIMDMTLVGNTAMHHIFLGIQPKYVSLMPYPAALQSSVNVKARDVGVNINRGAYIHVLPTIAGFVGGDAVADILATGIHKSDELSMLIDIGTNTEIVLGDKDKLFACSCASGPAFEGAHIKYGMRASTGAIEHIWIDPETLEIGYSTIGEEKPRGLCGSAIIDAVAEFLKNGIIDQSGRFNSDLKTARLRWVNKLREFVIAWKEETSINNDIVTTQEDIREIQLAKAAIYAGASILMKRMGILPKDIKKIFLAGAFGNYVDPKNAKIIGMYPDVPLERVQFAGNTAGSGARMSLLSLDARREAEEIAKRVEYVELGADPAFQDEFLKATYLPHQEIERFRNIAIQLKKRCKD